MAHDYKRIGSITHDETHTSSERRCRGSGRVCGSCASRGA